MYSGTGVVALTSVPDEQKDATMVMGRRDGATVAAFGGGGMRGGKAGCAHVLEPGGVAREF